VLVALQAGFDIHLGDVPRAFVGAHEACHFDLRPDAESDETDRAPAELGSHPEPFIDAGVVATSPRMVAVTITVNLVFAPIGEPYCAFDLAGLLVVFLFKDVLDVSLFGIVDEGRKSGTEVELRVAFAVVEGDAPVLVGFDKRETEMSVAELVDLSLER
jgi:hypothetical protein